LPAQPENFAEFVVTLNIIGRVIRRRRVKVGGGIALEATPLAGRFCAGDRRNGAACRLKRLRS